ncbi:MAG: HAD-IA family hydrolase [Rikenellaceae bacterium]
MQTRLLLLDFDGTLVDTRQANYRAYRDVLGEVNFSLDEDRYLNEFFGLRCGDFMRRLGFTDSYEIDRLRRRKIDIYPEHFGTIVLCEWLWGFAQSFRAQGGKVWIVSTGQAMNVRNVMKYFDIEDKVDGIMTGADVMDAKPSPECFIKAMAAEGVKPEETIIFEDSLFGLEAARKIGAQYVKVSFD